MMRVAPMDPLGRTVEELRGEVCSRLGAERLAMYAVSAEFLETGKMTYDRARELEREFTRLGAQREMASNGRVDRHYFHNPLKSAFYARLMGTAEEMEAFLTPSPEQLEGMRDKHARWLAGEDFRWPILRRMADRFARTAPVAEGHEDK